MISIHKNFQIKDFNTFHIPVTSRYFSTFSTEEELREILSFVHEKNLRFYVIGGGANLLFTKDFDGMLIHPVSDQIKVCGDTIVADAGVVWDRLVQKSIESGLGGLENLSLIPGSVGAAPVQNIGAYGSEAKDSLLYVEYMGVDDGKVHRLDKNLCRFGYRDSVFKHELAGQAVILRVAFGLCREESSYPYKLDYGALKEKVYELGGPSIKNVREATIAIRQSKLPDPARLGNAGSFFRNPEIPRAQFENLCSRYPDIVGYPLQSGKVKVSAGWLIEKSGWKGRSLGNAAVHDKQALVLVNKGGASGNEILSLCEKVRSDVFAMFSISLQPEVIIL